MGWDGGQAGREKKGKRDKPRVDGERVSHKNSVGVLNYLRRMHTFCCCKEQSLTRAD